MKFVVSYRCKENHIHEALFEPNISDLVAYFKEVKNLILTEDQCKYISFDKLCIDDSFKTWAVNYGSNKKQKEYDEFYKLKLNEAAEDLILNETSIDDEKLNFYMKKHFLSKYAKSNLKRKFNNRKGR